MLYDFFYLYQFIDEVVNIKVYKKEFFYSNFYYLFIFQIFFIIESLFTTLSDKDIF